MDFLTEIGRRFLGNYGLNVAAALVVLAVGWCTARIFRRVVVRASRRAGLDETLAVFLSRLTYIAVVALAVVAMLQKLGIETTSFAAMIAAAGLAIGLALQSSLSNFANGIMIITLRPFKVGDLIETSGISGAVSAVSVFATELTTGDNRKIFVPNSKVVSGNLTNYSANPTRRIDMVIGIGYEDDIRKAKRVLEQIVTSDERVLKDPAPIVAVSELGESSVDFVLRPWVKSTDYWAVRFDLIEAIKLRLDAENISIPFPQRELRVYNVAPKTA
jgi:small conductance mechanosensitive channel